MSIIKSPKKYLWLILMRYSRFLFKHNDEKYIKIEYYLTMGKWLDINKPITFNEKMQWLKIYNQNPDFSQFVDKAAAKKIISGIIGEEYIVPTLFVWDSPADIDFSILPQKFVLKCTHDSGGVIVCNNRLNLQEDVAKKKIEYFYRRDYFYIHREFPYKNVKKRIIAETYLSDGNEDLPDYKFMVFNGKVRLVFVCSDRRKKTGVKVDFYDCDWTHLPFERYYKNSGEKIKKPQNLKKMIELAEAIACKIDTPFVRIDFYEVKGKIYFGEVTFFPGSGLEWLSPAVWDKTLGDWLDLSAIKK